MPSCAIITCKARSQLASLAKGGVSFHRFPNDPVLKKKWIKATGRSDNWYPPKTATICSAHFDENDFQPSEKNRRLFPSAVPSIYLRQVLVPHLKTSQSPISTDSDDEHQSDGNKSDAMKSDGNQSDVNQSDENPIDDNRIGDHSDSDHSEGNESNVYITIPPIINEKQLVRRMEPAKKVARIKKFSLAVDKSFRILQRQKVKIRRLQKSVVRHKARMSQMKDILNKLGVTNVQL